MAATPQSEKPSRCSDCDMKLRICEWCGEEECLACTPCKLLWEDDGFGDEPEIWITSRGQIKMR